MSRGRRAGRGGEEPAPEAVAGEGAEEIDSDGPEPVAEKPVAAQRPASGGPAGGHPAGGVPAGRATAPGRARCCHRSCAA